MKAYSRFITEIRSHSHVLNETAFRLLMSEESLTRVLSVTEDSLKIEVIMTEGKLKLISEKDQHFSKKTGHSFLFVIPKAESL